MPSKKHSPIVPPLLGLFFGILAVSSSALFIRAGQREAPSLTIAAWRLCLATALLLPAAYRGRAEFLSIRRRDWFWLAVAGVALAFHFATWISSLAMTSVVSSIVLVSTSPLWVALAAPALLKERIPPAAVTGLVVTLAGGGIVAAGNVCAWGAGGLTCGAIGESFSQTGMLGNGLALAGGLFAAVYLLIGRRQRASLSLVTYTTVVYGVAAATLVGLMLASGARAVGFSVETYLSFLALAVIPQLLGHSTFNWALKYLPASSVSIAMLGEPVGATLLAFLFLSEIPSVLEAAGGAVLLAGIYLAIRSQPQVGEQSEPV